MTSPADLFALTLLATGGLYVSMLFYFNGLVGTKRPNTQILWNSEPIIWFITMLLVVSIAYRLLGPHVGQEGPGIWYLIGAGNLLVVFTYLILKLARHALPEKVCWAMAALIVVSILYVITNIVRAQLAGSLDPAAYTAQVATLLVLMILVLVLVLLFELVRSLGSSVMQIWSADSNAPERLTAGGIAITTTGNVTNPNGALSDIDLEPGVKTEEEWTTLHPAACIIVDFGLRRIEDHGFRSDLRIVRANANQPITVEVSNDNQNWYICFQDDKILSDWDVPYYSNPWRYVRICNKGNHATQVAEVYDLD